MGWVVGVLAAIVALPAIVAAGIGAAITAVVGYMIDVVRRID